MGMSKGLKTVDFIGYSGVKDNWRANPETDPPSLEMASLFREKKKDLQTSFQDRHLSVEQL